MNTKLITAYYPNHHGSPFWGKVDKNEQYKNSIISICGAGVPVVCYTDNQSLAELNQIKEENKLNNLVIKLYNLELSPFHRKIYNIRVTHSDLYNNENHPYYTTPFGIYWMKWNFLNMEYESDTYIYWVNIGLISKELSSSFNLKRLKLINEYTEGKILNLCKTTTNKNISEFETKLNTKIPNTFPVGIMFGGNSPHLLDYISLFNETAENILSLENYLCTEQEIMAYIHDKHNDWFKDWMFETLDNFLLDDVPLNKIPKKSLGNK